MLNGAHVLTPSWTVHDLHILLCQQSSHVTCDAGMALSWKSITFRPKAPVTEGRWMALPTMTEEPKLTLVGRMHASVYPFARSSHEHNHHCETAWSETLKWRQFLQRLRSHPLCAFPHAWRRRLWSKVNLWHLVGCLDRKPTVKHMFTMLRTDNLFLNGRIITRRRGSEI